MWNMDRGINHLIKSFNNSSKNFVLENNKLIKSKKQEQKYFLNPSSIQFGFNFYFNNVRSSPFTPMNSPKGHKNFNIINNNFNQKKIPISLLFKSSLEKSGYQISYKQTIINNNEYYNDYNNINNNYDESSFFNIPININYPINNNNALNNIHPTIVNVSNVKILSNSNITELPKDKINEKNIDNKKENIDFDILNSIIKKDKKVECEIKAKNSVIDTKEIKDNSFNNKTKVFFECSENNKSNSLKNFLKKKRFRKDSEQIIILSKFYNEHKNWTKTEIKEISKNTGLKEKKIYKWLWDKKNKDFNNTTKFIINKTNN